MSTSLGRISLPLAWLRGIRSDTYRETRLATTTTFSTSIRGGFVNSGVAF